MGAFTSIRHPEDGRELQIKTGWDSCEYYNVGDTVHWSVTPRPGYGTLLDGAYDSYSDRGWDDWVIIKDHKVHAVVPRGDEVTEASLWAMFNLQPPDRNLWTEEAWAEESERKAASEAEYAEFRRSIAHLPREKQVGLILARPLMQRAGWADIAKKAFKVEPL